MEPDKKLLGLDFSKNSSTVCLFLKVSQEDVLKGYGLISLAREIKGNPEFMMDIGLASSCQFIVQKAEENDFKNR